MTPATKDLVGVRVFRHGEVHVSAGEHPFDGTWRTRCGLTWDWPDRDRGLVDALPCPHCQPDEAMLTRTQRLAADLEEKVRHFRLHGGEQARRQMHAAFHRLEWWEDLRAGG